MAASWVGKELRFFVTLRNVMCSDSTALVVQMILRISSGKSKNGITRCQLRSHLAISSSPVATHVHAKTVRKQSAPHGNFWDKPRCYGFCMTSQEEVTQLLAEWGQGSQAAFDRLMPLFTPNCIAWRAATWPRRV